MPRGVAGVEEARRREGDLPDRPEEIACVVAGVGLGGVGDDGGGGGDGGEKEVGRERGRVH